MCDSRALALARALARFVGLADGAAALFFVVGDELRKRLDLFALQFADRGVGLDQLALVGRQHRLRPLELLLGVVEIDLGADLEVDRLLSRRDALTQRFDESGLEGDAHAQALEGRQFLRDLLVECAQRIGDLGQIGGEHRFFAQTHALRQCLAPVDLALRIGGERFEQGGRRAVLRGGALRGARGVDHQTTARHLGQIGVERVARGALVGEGFRRIELEQQISCLHAGAVLGVDGGDLARIERLDDLDAPSGFELAWRDRIDVETADEGPGDGEGEERTDGQHQRHGQWRRRRLQDLDRGGQKFSVASGDAGRGDVARLCGAAGEGGGHAKFLPGSDCSAQR